MRRLVALPLALLACAVAAGPAAAAENRATPRIVNGTTIASTEAPWTVAIQIEQGSGVGSCSGTILDATHVLTAAHCVVDGSSVAPASGILLAAGTPDITTKAAQAQGRVVGVKTVRVHPGYRSSEIPDDVAVLTLEAPLDFSGPTIQPLPMVPTGTYVFSGTTTRVFGFGITATNRDDFGILRRLSTETVPASLCGTDAPGALLCTFRRGRAACSGDSGGTATAVVKGQRVLIGVTDIAASECSAGLNLYANVAAPEIRGFIDAAVQEQNVSADQLPVSPRGGTRVRINTTRPRVGRTVTCMRGSWSGSGSLSYRFQFQFTKSGRSTRATSLSRKKTYRLKSRDRGWKVGCVVRATNVGGSGAGVSATFRTVRSR
ncbi:trypsin-like serine protease [Patulibacter brassicae]|jgi:secreted trypsin-like serine protease|uniref:Trypsin-like serine protease n=1 Tax=Patulibacter brassicae TaxID=1705717 RepID=A0ABU4VK14_9ACTN|nr:trypsin-like serine protease [Patulibacter brassicae]MDX8152172.1 trypsin-like serine protease [Patulibacter brassicae]